MRIRTIKPEFWSSAKMARVPREVRLVFIGLWNEADDDGRLLGSPKRLAGSLFEHDTDVDARVMDGWLGQLEAAGMIVRYEVKGTAYIVIPGFGEHQRIDKRWASRLPPPPAESLAQHRASLAQHSASLAEDCAPDMSSSGNDLLSEMTPFGEGNAPRPAPALPPPMVADEVLPAGPEERAEARRSGAVVRASLREHRGRGAAAAAIMGRPQSVDDLLALRVKEMSDGRIITAPEDGRPLRDLWAERYPTLDGKGQPRRKTVAEIAEVLWPYEVNRPWSLDGAGYLSWWASKFSEEAEKARRAWEAQGGATAGDPDRIEAKKRHLYLQGLGRDLPPFATWYEERWKRGLDRRDLDADDAPAPTGPSGGTRPSGSTRALPAPPTVDPFAAAAIPADAKAPNLSAMAEAARRRQREQESQ